MGETFLRENFLKSAHITRVVVCKVPSPRARIAASLLTPWRVGVAAVRRWELALWILNPAIAVQIRARSHIDLMYEIRCIRRGMAASDEQRTVPKRDAPTNITSLKPAIGPFTRPVVSKPWCSETPGNTAWLRRTNIPRHVGVFRDTPDLRVKCCLDTRQPPGKTAPEPTTPQLEARAVNRQPWYGEHRRWTSL